MPFLTKGKTNWKYILIVLILAFIVGGGIFGYSRYFKREISSLTQFPEIRKPQKIEEETANWKTYRNEEYGFEIKYPDGWLVKKEELGSIYSGFITQQIEPLDQVKFISSEDSKKSVAIIVYNNSKGYSLEEWLRIYSEISPTGVSLAWKEEFSVAGEKGLKGGFGCCMTYHQSAFLAKGNKIYQIEGGMRDLKTGTYEYETIFDQMLSTFRFIEGEMTNWKTYRFSVQGLRETEGLTQEKREEIEKKIIERKLESCSFEIKYPPDWTAYTWPLHGVIIPEGLFIEEDPETHKGCSFQVSFYGNPEKEKYCFPISFSSGESDPEKCNKIFNQMLSTFRFLPPK